MEIALDGEPQTEASLTLGEPAVIETEEFAALLAEGHERGAVTYEAVTAALEDAEASREQIAELHAYLDEHGIELVEVGVQLGDLLARSFCLLERGGDALVGQHAALVSLGEQRSKLLQLDNRRPSEGQ